MNILPEQLKKLREQKRWSYKDMGREIGVDYRAIKRYELGETQPPADILEAFAKTKKSCYGCYGSILKNNKICISGCLKLQHVQMRCDMIDLSKAKR